MPAFFDLLVKETDPAVRVVLGHFIFVCIHLQMVEVAGLVVTAMVNSRQGSNTFSSTETSQSLA